MDALLLLVVVVVAVMMLRVAHRRGGGMHDWIPVALGAVVGSSLAAWWRKAIRWALQVVSGAWFGAVSGSWLVLILEWPTTPDFFLLSGSIMGLMGYSIVDAVMRLDLSKILGKWAERKAE